MELWTGGVPSAVVMLLERRNGRRRLRDIDDDDDDDDDRRPKCKTVIDVTDSEAAHMHVIQVSYACWRRSANKMICAGG